MRNLKRIFLLSGVLTMILFIMHKSQILEYDIKGYLMVFEALVFCVFIVSLYTFFILSDISSNKFTYLGWLHTVSILMSLAFFIYWGIIYPNSLAFLYPAYIGIFSIFNLLLMSIIYSFKKTGDKYFLKHWISFFALIVFYIVYIIIKKE
jgi:hypothetical protein